MLTTPIRLWPLAIAHFFGVTALFAHVAVTSVLMQNWIDEPNSGIPAGLGTLPLAVLILLSGASIAPLGLAMQRMGYRRIFYVATLLGAFSGGMCMLSVILHGRGTVSPPAAVVLLALSIVPQGCAYGAVHFYRHVAAIVGRLSAPSGASVQQVTSRAVAVVITSGALAGIAGPGIADLTVEMIPGYKFAGTYACLAAISLMHTAVLTLTDADAAFVPPAPVQSPTEKETLLRIVNSPGFPDAAVPPPRSLFTIVTQRSYFVAMCTATTAHGMMLILMSITPLLLHGKVHFAYASLVIQIHVLCMYIPSFGTSKVIAALGATKVAVIGLVVSLAGAALMFVEPRDVWSYYAAVMCSLALIGLGWNFTYVSATTSVAGAYAANERFKAQSFNDVTVFTVGAILTLAAGPLLHYFGIRHLASGCIAVYVATFIANVVMRFVSKGANPLAPSQAAAPVVVVVANVASGEAEPSK